MIFTKSNRQWKAKPLDEQAISDFYESAGEFDHIFPVAVHASYLINIGSPDPALWEKSYQALKVEVDRAEALGISTLTFHPGAFKDTDEETGLENIARGMSQLLNETEGYQTIICLETTAGAGTHLVSGGSSSTNNSGITLFVPKDQFFEITSPGGICQSSLSVA